MNNNQNYINYELQLHDKTIKNVSKLETLASVVKAASIIIVFFTIIASRDILSIDESGIAAITLIINITKTILTGWVIGAILGWCANMLEITKIKK